MKKYCLLVAVCMTIWYPQSVLADRIFPPKMPNIHLFVQTLDTEKPCGRFVAYDYKIMGSSARHEEDEVVEEWNLYFLDEMRHPLLIVHEFFNRDGVKTREIWHDPDRNGTIDHFEINIYPDNSFFKKYSSVCDAVKN